MADNYKQIGLRLSDEQFDLLSNLASRYDMEIPKLVRFLLFECFANQKFLDSALRKDEGPVTEKLIDSIYDRLSGQEDQTIKLIDNLTRQIEYFKRICLAQYNLLANMGYRLCVKGYEAEWSKFLAELQEKYKI